MHQLLFATHNNHKAQEIAAALPGSIQLLTLKDLQLLDEIPEPFDSLAENAWAKADYLFQKTQLNCFSEDTGLIVDALNGAPGVKSARYAGEHKSDEDNIDLLLHNLAHTHHRKARFKTVIALYWNGEKHEFEGVCEGEITHDRSGDKGFGYDPVFQPIGATKRFAEMSMAEKRVYSHREKAVQQMLQFLSSKIV